MATVTPYSKFWKRNTKGATPDDSENESEINDYTSVPKKKPSIATTMPIKRKTPIATTMPVGGRRKSPTATTMPINRSNSPEATTMPIKTKDAMMAARQKAIQRRLRKSRA